MGLIQVGALVLSMLAIGFSLATLRRLDRISRETRVMIHEADRMIEKLR